VPLIQPEKAKTLEKKKNGGGKSVKKEGGKRRNHFGGTTLLGVESRTIQAMKKDKQRRIPV